MSVTVAIDCMGGDHGPAVTVPAALSFLRSHADARVILVGKPDVLEPALGSAAGSFGERLRIHPASEVVGMDESPVVAMKNKKDSSMRVAANLVKSGDAQAAVSAGNTGALMAISRFVLKTLPGIDRPAIASFFPTRRGESVMLDLGANIECDAANLVQFAIMGDVFARAVLGMPKPTIGLLNVGAEDQKGHENIRSAAAILRATTLPLDFRGFIEGDDIGAGTVDVIVTDGFTGNVALKTAEGMAKLITTFLRECFKSSFMARVGYVLSRTALKRLSLRIDPRRYNGAMFLGLNGIVVKSHGGTDEFGFANAIGVAADLCRQGFIDRIRDEIGNLAQELNEKKAAAI